MTAIGASAIQASVFQPSAIGFGFLRLTPERPESERPAPVPVTSHPKHFMQILHIATTGLSGSNQVMATRTTKSRTHRDVFTLAARLGYAPKAVAALQQKVADTDFTAMLEARRQAAGLTQAEVARRMGVTQSTVSRLESDRWQDLRLGELDAYLRAVVG